MGNLVQIIAGEPLTNSLILSKGMKINHKAVMQLVTKYRTMLEGHGVLTFQKSKPQGKKGGRPFDIIWLNESQTVFLITLMRNSEIVVNFKNELTKEFFKQRRLLASLLSQRQNSEWLQKREQGVLSRREETDTIKAFVEYSKKQGASKPEYYYANLSKMENKALFIVEQEFKNLRDCLSGQQLSIVATADIAVAKALQAGMDDGQHYTNIYQLAKERMEAFAEIVGKSLVPMTLTSASPSPALPNPAPENQSFLG